MSFFVRLTNAPAMKTANVGKISLLLAGPLLIMALAQLFNFEKFPSILEHMGLTNEVQAKLVAALLVTTEVLALPFLLRLKLSNAMRIFSMVMGWLTVLLWVLLAIWQNVHAASTNNGILGATVALPVGIWTIFFFIGLGVLTIWAAWGMWPIQKEV